MKNYLIILITFFLCSCSKLENEKSFSFIGDSHIERWDLGYYFPTIKYNNLGQSGKLISEVNSQFIITQNILGKTKVAILQVGTNNIVKKCCNDSLFLSTFMNDYTSLVDDLAKKFDKVYLIQLIPLSVKNPLVKTKIPSLKSVYFEIDNKISNYYKNQPTIEYIRLPSHLVEDYLLKNDFSYDGIHLNKRGYEILSTKIANYLH